MKQKSHTTTSVREQGAYSISEAARYLKVPQATLRTWVLGRPGSSRKGAAPVESLIQAASPNPLLLSFFNLVEAYVLRSLRADHGVAMTQVRQALHFAEQALAVEHLLRRQDLCTFASEMFLEKYGELINLNRSGQLAMASMLEEDLKRIEWDQCRFPIRLFPFVRREATTVRPIAIDPEIAFGRPVLVRARIATQTIVDRIDAGETVAALADDYELTNAEIEVALVYERSA